VAAQAVPLDPLYSASRRKISALGTDMMLRTASVKRSYSSECFIRPHAISVYTDWLIFPTTLAIKSGLEVPNFIVEVEKDPA
jgi:hypothetical protein